METGASTPGAAITPFRLTFPPGETKVAIRRDLAVMALVGARVVRKKEKTWFAKNVCLLLKILLWAFSLVNLIFPNYLNYFFYLDISNKRNLNIMVFLPTACPAREPGPPGHSIIPALPSGSPKGDKGEWNHEKFS